MTERSDFAAALAASRIPEHMHGGVSRYILKGIPPGNFLASLLSNDLRATFERADDENALAVLHYLRFFYNNVPSQAWGSAEKFKDWVLTGGWEGLDARFAAEAVERAATPA